MKFDWDYEEKCHYLGKERSLTQISFNLTILEGKKLKDTMHDGDNDGESQEVGVGFQKGHLYKELNN